jgi:hypothetical protein
LNYFDYKFNGRTKLQITPVCGLCNRMRVIDSAIRFAIDFKFKIEIYWIKNEDLYCGFEDLFDLNFINKYVSVKVYETDKIHENYFQKIKKFFFKYNHFYFNDDFLVNNNFNSIYDNAYRDFVKRINSLDNYQNLIRAKWSNILSDGNITGLTYSRFYGPINSSYHYFRPQHLISQKSYRILEQFPVNILGVHIRRTDNQLSTLTSTRTKFIDSISLYLKDNPNSKIFLATDDISEKKYFEKYFAPYIIIYESELVRNKQLGIKDALLELYCLSHCSFIIGSYFSSFTEIAICYNKKKDYIIID